MKIVQVVCNPRPGSFNLALARCAKERLLAAGHEVLFHDLYEEGFDPILAAPELARGYSLDEIVQVHCRELATSDGLLVFHPDWWGQPPALLKGWIDRVFRQGIAYDIDDYGSSEREMEPLLSGKKALVFCTSDEREDETPRILESFWRDVVLGRCGMEAACHVLRDMRRRDPGRRRAWQDFMIRTIDEWFPALAYDA